MTARRSIGGPLRAALAAALACGLLGVLAAPASALKLTQIGIWDEALYADNAPGKENRKLLFIVQKPGIVSVQAGNKRVAHPFLNVTDITHAPSGSEQGLLSIAFHPNYERNRLFYVYLTQKDRNNSVWEFKRSKKSPLRTIRKSGRRVLVIPHDPDPVTNHNGGQLQFGPDKMLYIAPGDGGSTPNAAQDVNSLRGKVLRIDPRKQGGRKGSAATAARKAYGIPKGNPFAGKPGLDEIYAMGLRNPFRFSFDRANGAILIGDVGGSQREELDYRLPGKLAGTNFGWPRFEGTIDTGSGAPVSGAVGPIFEYDHSGGGCVITAGYVIHDHRLPGLNGRFIWGDFCLGQIRTLVPSPGGASGDAPLGVPNVSNLASFAEGRKGRIYVISLAGNVYRLDP